MQETIDFEALKFEDCIDKSLLEKLHTLLQHEPFGNLLDTFQERAQINIEKAGLSLRTDNFEDLRFVIHGLKGSSANVGATRLSGLCSSFEIKLKNEEPAENLQSAYDDIANMYHVSIKFMQQYYDETGKSDEGSNVA